MSKINDTQLNITNGVVHFDSNKPVAVQCTYGPINGAIMNSDEVQTNVSTELLLKL